MIYKDIIENGVEYSVRQDDGHTIWCKKGTYIWHREGDLPAYISSNGVYQWWINDQLHCTTGPAIIYLGIKEWYYRGEKLEHISSQQELEQWLKLRVFV